MSGLQFTAMNDGDIEPVKELWRRCGLLRPWNDPDKDIAFARREASSEVLVSRNGASIVASVMVGHDGHRGAVYYVSVDPDVQNRGYGKQVMAAAENWLKDEGVWKLNLLVRAENEAVRGFYEALGYEVEPRLCMARKLLDDEDAQSKSS